MILCCVYHEPRDPTGGVVDTHGGKILFCASCVERLTRQIERLCPGRSLQLLREAIDCIAEDAARAMGLAKLAATTGILSHDKNR